MSEAERQFREKGWTRNASDMWKWNHPLHGTLFITPDNKDVEMDLWLSGYSAGKEGGE